MTSMTPEDSIRLELEAAEDRTVIKMLRVRVDLLLKGTPSAHRLAASDKLQAAISDLQLDLERIESIKQL